LPAVLVVRLAASQACDGTVRMLYLMFVSAYEGVLAQHSPSLQDTNS
jgi:hypothetical protein